jgi:hypothetical protein
MIEYVALGVGLAILLLAVDIGGVFDSKRSRPMLFYFTFVGLLLIFMVPALVWSGLAKASLSASNTSFVESAAVGLTLFILGLGTIIKNEIKSYKTKQHKDLLWARCLFWSLLIVGTAVILLADAGYL